MPNLKWPAYGTTTAAISLFKRCPRTSFFRFMKRKLLLHIHDTVVVRPRTHDVKLRILMVTWSKITEWELTRKIDLKLLYIRLWIELCKWHRQQESAILACFLWLTENANIAHDWYTCIANREANGYYVLGHSMSVHPASSPLGLKFCWNMICLKNASILSTTNWIIGYEVMAMRKIALFVFIQP